ncbi:malate dehydrogenase [Podospora didyma]|uniref:Malate dehydrogenase n=1 Tax=Podospora didyma TaxID=330526 RepID=A0AAE0N5G7_9PEZI|nr:malate dehydrogenase [Podospora didyma]
MRTSTLLLSALGATVFAAPTLPVLNPDAALPGSIDTVSEYFNMLASKVQASKLMSLAPVCDLSKAQLPVLTGATTLPPPTAGFVLKHVALGRGTQNYTCDVNNATAVPAANGAIATLFNASCIAATYPDLAKQLSKVALQFNLTGDETKMSPSNLAVTGSHWFPNLTTPFFNLDVSRDLKLGQAACAKNNSAPAPADAAKGQQGEPAVPWLKLVTKAGTTGDLQEVYRVETAGGSAPATCKGMPASFTVQYAAEYWFYAGKK